MERMARKRIEGVRFDPNVLWDLPPVSGDWLVVEPGAAEGNMAGWLAAGSQLIIVAPSNARQRLREMKVSATPTESAVARPR